MSDPLFQPSQAADYLDLTVSFLEARRHRGDGPPFVRISGRCVRYRRSDLDEWIGDRIRLSTSDVRDDES